MEGRIEKFIDGKLVFVKMCGEAFQSLEAKQVGGTNYCTLEKDHEGNHSEYFLDRKNLEVI